MELNDYPYIGGTLVVEADQREAVALYTINGACVAYKRLEKGEKLTLNLPSGIYLLNGEKKILK